MDGANQMGHIVWCNAQSRADVCPPGDPNGQKADKICVHLSRPVGVALVQ